MWCFIYKSYGEWRITSLFPTQRAAERHADLYLRQPDKDYITDLKLRFISLED